MHVFVCVRAVSILVFIPSAWFVITHVRLMVLNSTWYSKLTKQTPTNANKTNEKVQSKDEEVHEYEANKRAQKQSTNTANENEKVADEIDENDPNITMAPLSSLWLNTAYRSLSQLNLQHTK